jgi:hypothetical protein
MTAPHASFLLVAALLAAPARADDASLVRPAADEPSPEIIRSGACHVPVCTAFDLGDHSLLVYAPGRPALLRHVPAEACTCGRIAPAANFTGIFGTTLEMADGSQVPYVILRRVRRPGEPGFRGPVFTTAERQALERDRYAEVTGVVSGGDSFADFRVLETADRASVRFVPKDAAFRFRGAAQAVAFETLFGGLEESREGPRLRAEVRLMPTIHLTQMIFARRTPSAEWIAALERSAAAIDLRLLPNHDGAPIPSAAGPGAEGATATGSTRAP